VTDGRTNDNDRSKFRVFSAALRTVCRVVAVGVAGNGYTIAEQQQQRAELDQIASSPEDRFYEMSFKDLNDHVGEIARRACPV